MTTRSPAAVFEAHLRLRAAGDLETDLRENYANDVVLLCSYGVFQGVDAVRQSADRLGLQLPGAHFDYVTRVTHGEYAFLEWKATSDRFRINNGADSFVIRNGRIHMQTIHYTLLSPENVRQSDADGQSG